MGSTITIDFHGRPARRHPRRYARRARSPSAARDRHGVELERAAPARPPGRHPRRGPYVSCTRGPIPRPSACRSTSCPGFLFTIDASRVAEAVRPKVLDYQRECFRVLADACLGRPSSQIGHTAEILSPSPIATPDPRICIRMVTEARHVFGIQPARELWFALGLPRTPAMMAGPRQGDLFTYRREA